MHPELDWDDPVAVFNRSVAEQRAQRRGQLPNVLARTRSRSARSQSRSSDLDSDSGSDAERRRRRKQRKKKRRQEDREYRLLERDTRRRIRGEALQRLLVDTKTENRIMDFKQTQAAEQQLRSLGPLESITTRVRLMSEHLNSAPARDD